jgi:endonuclease YncB( thermonuclease family)
MASGMLRIKGTLDVAQFWTKGDSDGDTVKVKLSGAGACAFRPHPGAAFKTTHAFEGAVVKGRVAKAPIDAKGRMTIRLQGVDTPELHYRPEPPTKPTPTAAQKAAFKAARGAGDFRQALAEAATLALVKRLGGFNAGELKCEALTAVDAPNDVFDTYGRAVADVFVTVKGHKLHLNRWLVQRGWGFPSYYSSMSEDEIRDIEALAAKASKPTKKRGAWRKYTSDLTGFDFNLRFRPHGPADPDGDVGPVVMPKLFRRQSVFAVAKKAGVVDGNIAAFLKAHPDSCFETDEFLEQGPNAATVAHIHDFVTPAGKFTKGPGDLVFRESASKIVGPDGKPVNW